jgi:hypothetical protein
MVKRWLKALFLYYSLKVRRGAFFCVERVIGGGRGRCEVEFRLFVYIRDLISQNGMIFTLRGH